MIDAFDPSGSPPQDGRPTPGAQRAARFRNYGLVLFVALAAHLPALGADFQFDDFHHLVENPSIRSLSYLPDFFIDPSHFSDQVGAANMYRPLLMVTQALTYFIMGPGPFGFHLVNLVLHLFNCVLVLAWLRRTIDDRLIATLGAMFWAVAAIQHETVAYAAARSSLLAASSMLLALRVSDLDEPSPRPAAALVRGLGVFGLGALALLAKEIAFVLPLLILVRDLTLGRARGLRLRPRLPIYLAAFALMPLYLILRKLIMASVLTSPYVARELYLATQARVMFYYLAKIAWPVNLTLVPDIKVGPSLTDWRVLVAAPAVALILMAAAALWRKAPRFSFGAFWFVICLLPTSSLAPLFLVASIERVYLPLLGVVVALGGAVMALFPKREKQWAAAVSLGLIIVVLNGAVTVSRHLAWRSRIGLMRETVTLAPDWSVGWLWLAINEIYDEKLDFARAHLKMARKLDPAHPLLAQTFAKLDFYSGAEDDARARWEKILVTPSATIDAKIDALLKLAGLELGQGELDSARARAQKAIELQPDNAVARLMLGSVEESAGAPDQAEANYRRALEIFPDYPEVWNKLGLFLIDQGRVEEGRGWLLKVVKRDLPWAEAYAGLGKASFFEFSQTQDRGRAMKKLDEARQWYERAIEVDPKSPIGYFGLGLCHAVVGELEKARTQLEQAVQADPNFLEARSVLVRVYIDLIQRGGLPEQEERALADKIEAQLAELLPQGLGRDESNLWERLRRERSRP